MTYIDTAELTVRIAEACLGMKRPAGITAEQALKNLRVMDSDSAEGWMRAALAAAEYIAECCNAVNPGQVEIKCVAVANPGGLPQ